MTNLQAFVLGCVQGIAEFLPISSTAHLMIAQHWFGLGVDTQQILFDLVLHGATLLSIVCVLGRDIMDAFKQRMNLSFLIYALIPTICIGLIFARFDHFFVEIRVIACFLMLNACILYLGHLCSKKSGSKELSFRRSWMIGCAQGLAVLPGLSRSGTTISAALSLGVRSSTAFLYSFLLAIPTILLALAYELLLHRKEISQLAIQPLVIGFITAFVTGTISLYVLKHIFEQKKLHIFALYCAGVAVYLLWKG